MGTEEQKQNLFYSSYAAIEKEIINGSDKFKHQTDKAESAKTLFHQQIDGLTPDLVLDYIGYIKEQEISGAFFREGLSQLKSYLTSIEYKIKLSTPPLPKPFEGLLKKLNDDQLKKLFAFLTIKHENCKNAFIKTDKINFKYVFGGKDKPNSYKPIEYTASNKQWLREIFTELQKEVKYHTDKVTGKQTRVLSHEIIRQIPLYFMKDNKKLELGKGKEVPSFETDRIKKNLATL